MAHVTELKTIVAAIRGDIDQALTELLEGAGPRYKTKLFALQRHVGHVRMAADQLMTALEDRMTHAEGIAAIRAETIQAHNETIAGWKRIAAQHGANVAQYEAPGSTH